MDNFGQLCACAYDKNYVNTQLTLNFTTTDKYRLGDLAIIIACS
jgi:hypothetical protein